MQLTLLGSGGDSQTPMPTCACRVCELAREEGTPHARLGNSTLVRDANAVVFGVIVKLGNSSATVVS